MRVQSIGTNNYQNNNRETNRDRYTAFGMTITNEFHDVINKIPKMRSIGQKPVSKKTMQRVHENLDQLRFKDNNLTIGAYDPEDGKTITLLICKDNNKPKGISISLEKGELSSLLKGIIAFLSDKGGRMTDFIQGKEICKDFSIESFNNYVFGNYICKRSKAKAPVLN